MSQPRIQRQGRKLQIGYESSHRLNCTKTYPVKSSNGSNIVLFATNSGLRITWSGGKPLFFALQTEPGVATSSYAPLDAHAIAQEPESDDEPLYDSEEEDLDEDHPYPSIVQEVDIALESPALHIAVPPLPAKRSSNAPDILYESIIVAVACENGTTYVVTLPLDPPSTPAKRKGTLRGHVIPLGVADSGLPRGIALGWTGRGDSDGDHSRPRYETRHSADHVRTDFSLLVALGTSEFSGQLHIFTLPITKSGARHRVEASSTTHPALSELLDCPPTALAFATPTRATPDQTRLLVSDVRGFTTVFEVVKPAAPSGRSSKLVSAHIIFKLSAPYSSSEAPNSLSKSTKKKILAASWVLSGEAIFVLLDDGHAGLYALDAEPPADLRSRPAPLSFACETFIGDAPEHTPSQPLNSARSRKPQLAPMTPNTRRAKSNALFVEQPSTSATSTASRGGFCIAPTASPSDNAILLWFNNNLFHIPSLRNFWAQSDRADAQGSVFSSRSAITALEEPDLHHERIVSVALLPSKGDGSRTLFGGVAPSSPDFLVVAEYRSIIFAKVRDAMPAPMGDEESVDSPGASPAVRAVDRRMLERGELGLDGVDRLLDNMVGIENGPVTRRVDFREG